MALVGFAHPIQLSPSGGVALVQDADVLSRSITQLVGTRCLTARGERGELPWAPEYGTNLEALRFEPTSQLLAAVAGTRTSTAIATHEPRVQVQAVRSEADVIGGAVDVTITWSARAISGANVQTRVST